MGVSKLKKLVFGIPVALLAQTADLKNGCGLPMWGCASHHAGVLVRGTGGRRFMRRPDSAERTAAYARQINPSTGDGTVHALPIASRCARWPWRASTGRGR